MAQRVSIAVCLARGAKTVFADEPASGLDRESRESLLELLEELHLAGDLTTLVLVTHDFEVAGRIGHRLVVMDEGKVIEQGEVSDILGIPGPSHPRTRRLLEDFRRLEIPRVKVASNKGGPPRLRVQDIWCSYRSPWRFGRRRREAVLKGANLEVCPGEVVGLVGPSGSGKTTLAGVVVRLVTPDRGSVDLEGTDLLALDGAVLRAKRRELQLLFQQVRAAIHPRMRVREALMETATWVRCLGPGDARREVDRVLRAVDLADLVDAFPSHLSGGELRRVGIARVLLARPRLLIVDEPTVGVDASLRAGVLELLDDLRRRRDGPSILLISHDWKVVNHLCDRIYEIRDGRLFPAPRDGRGPASPEPRRRSPGCRKEKGATP